MFLFGFKLCPFCLFNLCLMLGTDVWTIYLCQSRISCLCRTCKQHLFTQHLKGIISWNVQIIPQKRKP